MPGTRGRSPKLQTTEARRKAVELRARGFSTAEIGRWPGMTRQYAWRLLSNHGRDEMAAGIVACRLCGRPVIQGGDALRNNDPVPCLDCLRDRPQLPFAVRLKAFRMAAGWTQEELARRAKMSVFTIRMYERGQAQAKWKNLVKLMRTLGPDWSPWGLSRAKGRRSMGERIIGHARFVDGTTWPVYLDGERQYVTDEGQLVYSGLSEKAIPAQGIEGRGCLWSSEMEKLPGFWNPWLHL